MKGVLQHPTFNALASISAIVTVGTYSRKNMNIPTILRSYQAACSGIPQLRQYTGFQRVQLENTYQKTTDMLLIPVKIKFFFSGHDAQFFSSHSLQVSYIKVQQPNLCKQNEFVYILKLFKWSLGSCDLSN